MQTFEKNAYQWGYRPALTGIRALAVYLVVLFHSEIALFSSGYIGVDLFFVLSGFLVCNVLADEYEKNGRLKLSTFYSRRIRRLLPAMGVMVLMVSLFYVLLQSAADRVRYIPSARSAILYFANWNFIVQSADYFSPESKSNPFVHLWSLSIEEQFYFFFPIFLAATYKLSKRFGNRFLLAIPMFFMFVSLVDQLLLSGSSIRSYYGTDAKIYQLLAGATLAIWVRHREDAFNLATSLKNKIGVFALVFFVLLATRFSVPISVSQVGILATTLGVLVIFSIEIHQNGLLNQIFSFRPFVYLGNISYATYLWHWPIIVVLRQLFDMGPVVLGACAVCLSTIFASASYHMLELPIRKTKFAFKNSFKSISIGACMSVLCAFLLIPFILNYEKDPVIKIRTVPVAFGSSNYLNGETAVTSSDFVDEPLPLFPLPNCIGVDLGGCYLNRGSGATVLLLGDSHAINIAEMLIDAAKRLDISLVISAAGHCPWPIGLRLPNIESKERLQLCEDIEGENLQRVIPEVNPSLIIVTNRTFDSSYRIESIGEQGLENANQLARETVNKLAADGRKLLIIEPIPETNGFNSRACVLDALTTEKRQLCAFQISLDATKFELFEREMDSSRIDVLTLNIDNWVCPRAPICDPTGNGAIVWSDDNHISPGYARTLGSRMAEFLKATQFLEAIDR